MKFRLIIMRHAKSSWDAPELRDHDRPLNKRGKKDAPKIAHALVKLKWEPDLILSSSSERTRQTFALMLDVFPPETCTQIVPEFYGGSYDNITHELEKLENERATVLVLGHNPGWEYSLSYFTNQHLSMTTANAALLEAEAEDWIEAISKFQFIRILRPKELD